MSQGFQSEHTLKVVLQKLTPGLQSLIVAIPLICQLKSLDFTDHVILYKNIVKASRLEIQREEDVFIGNRIFARSLSVEMCT